MKCKKVSADKPCKFFVRLTDMQYNYIHSVSSSLGISESEFVRMIIDKNISITNKEFYNYENKKRY